MHGMCCSGHVLYAAKHAPAPLNSVSMRGLCYAFLYLVYSMLHRPQSLHALFALSAN